MRINKVELYRYKPFLYSEIELFDMDMPNLIQNIIGTNGSGKTSLLQEINPQPATRTDFGESGYKKIVLTHQNSEYVLTSDFSNHSSPHSFVKDDVELNTSGTTGVQEDLISSHLGYTQLVHSVSYGKNQLSKMPVGSRKTFLLTIHPCQMKLILDKHKKVSQALRACRDNLSMLHERKASLATVLLEPELIEEMKDSREHFEHELSLVIDAIHKLNNQKSNLQKEMNTRYSNHGVRSRKEILSGLVAFTRYTSIPRDVPIEVLHNSNTNEISILCTKMTGLEARARDLTLEIDKYEDHIRQNDAKGALELVESTIENLSLDITQLERNRIDNPFDAYVLDKLPEHISYLTDLISFFIGYGHPIPSRKDVTDLQNKLDGLNIQRRTTWYELSQARDRLAQHSKTLTSKLIADIPDGCSGCILFRNYRNSISEAQTNYDAATHEVEILERKHARLDSVIHGRAEVLAVYEKSVPHLQRISDYLSEYRYLLAPLVGIEFVEMIRKNPSMLVIRIQRHYDLSRDHYSLLKKKAELERLVLEQEKLKSPSQFGQQFLEQMVREKQEELNVIHIEYHQLKERKEEIAQFLFLLDDYTNTLRSAKKELEDANVFGEYATLQHEKEACDLYLEHLSTVKVQIVSRLTDIDRTLREQDMYHARYQDEVIVNIEKISVLEKEYVLVEKALSPTHGIPHKYMVQFLNDVLKRANVFISEVFSYPFEFVPLDEHTPFDYKFKMYVGDVPIPDVSDGSDAQQEVANFAFNLGLAVQLRMTDYALMLDECGRTFDTHHKQKLVEFLKTIVDDGIVAQLFLINHHATISAGLLNSDTVVLNPDNIVVPTKYNEYVLIEKY